jgi:hypothetical protein
MSEGRTALKVASREAARGRKVEQAASGAPKGLGRAAKAGASMSRSRSMKNPKANSNNRQWNKVTVVEFRVRRER